MLLFAKVKLVPELPRFSLLLNNSVRQSAEDNVALAVYFCLKLLGYGCWIEALKSGLAL